MEESAKEKIDFIKVLNTEKILEFKKNSSTGFDEAEITIENNAKDSMVISKIYINNYAHFKCVPNIAVINKNSTIKIKVILNDKNYKVSNSDIFLIISHPVKEEDTNNMNNQKLNEFFKNNLFKEKGQKLFMIAYKKEEKENHKIIGGDALMEKIKELEKQVFEQKDVIEEDAKEKIEEKEKEKEKEKKPKIEEANVTANKNSNSIYLLCLSLLVLLSAFIFYKLLKK